MKYIALMTAGACTLVLLFAWLWPYSAKHGCADVHSTPMGTVIEGPNAKSRFAWDDKCPSGVAWIAK